MLHIYRMVSVFFSVLVLAKSCTGHHYFESSGKNITAHTLYGQILKRFLLNIIFIFLMVIANFIAATIIIKSDTSKYIWISFAGVLLPTCFVSRDSFKNKDSSFGRKMFLRFYQYNGVLFFFIFGVAALITTNFIIRYTSVSSFNCDNCPRSAALSSPVFDPPPPPTLLENKLRDKLT